MKGLLVGVMILIILLAVFIDSGAAYKKCREHHSADTCHTVIE